MVGGHAIAQFGQATRIFDRANRTWLRKRHSGEKWWLLNVRALGVPLIHVAARGGNFFPLVAAVKHTGVLRAKLFVGHTGGNRRVNFFLTWPHVAQVHGLAGL